MPSLLAEPSDARAASPNWAAARRVFWLLAAIALVVLARSGTAQDAPAPPASPTGPDLTQLSLEDLMDVSIEVTSVSGKPQAASSTAAALHVITAEDIRRSGLHSLPEVLRLVPGLHVARVSASAWAISSRGFNGRFNGNLLLLIDGRSAYSPLFSGVYWDVQDVLLEDIERIEVILGPGAAVWGANAVNGVINVITRKATETTDGLATVLVGEEERAIVGVREGGRLDDGAWRVFAKSSNLDAQEAADGGAAGDERDLQHAGFRVDRKVGASDALTFEGDAYSGRNRMDEELPSLTSPPAVAESGIEKVWGADVIARWSHDIAPGDSVEVQGYVDATDRESDVVREHRETVDLQARRHVHVSDVHDLVYGANLRLSQSAVDNSALSQFIPDKRTETLAGVFAEDEVTLVPDRLKLTAGARLEQATFAGLELQPNLRLAWTPSADTTWWAAVSRAVRTPSQAEHDGNFPLFVSTTAIPGFATVFQLQGSGVQEDSVIAWEAGWRSHVAQPLWLDVSVFRDDYQHRIEFVTGAPVPLGPGQLKVPVTPTSVSGEVAEGAEASATFEASQAWQVQAAYTWLDVRTVQGPGFSLATAAEGSAPKHTALLRSHHVLGEAWDMDVDFFHVSALPARGVQAYWRGDVRLGWRPDARTEWTLGVQNLFHDGDREWDLDFSGGATAPQTSVYLQVVRHF